MNNKLEWKVLFLLVATAVFMTSSAVSAQVIELEVIEIESEVPRRVAQFFVQRDRLHYQPIDRQPTFLPELLESVEEKPF